jgi:hypothetical protein
MYLNGALHATSTTVSTDALTKYGFTFTAHGTGSIEYAVTFKFYTTDNETSDQAGFNVTVRDIACFAPDTYVATPTGAIKLRDMTEGLLVYSATAFGEPVSVRKVEKVLNHYGSFKALSINGVLSTLEHPWHDGSTWVDASEVKAIVAVDPLNSTFKVVAPEVSPIESLEHSMNLTVAEDHTFMVSSSANGPWYWVHNKIQYPTGCVPAGTLFHTPTGSIPIEQVVEGTFAAAYDEATFLPIRAMVRKLHVFPDRQMFKLTTEHGSLICSNDHRPFRKESKPSEVNQGEHWPAVREMVQGDTTLWDVNGTLYESKVLAVEDLGRRETVYHVSLDCAHVYVAGGLPAHNIAASQDTIDIISVK